MIKKLVLGLSILVYLEQVLAKIKSLFIIFSNDFTFFLFIIYREKCKKNELISICKMQVHKVFPILSLLCINHQTTFDLIFPYENYQIIFFFNYLTINRVIF